MNGVLICNMLVREILFLSSDVCGNYVLSVLSASPPNDLVVSFLTDIQYILASALISRCRDSNLYDCQFFFDFLEACHVHGNYATL